MVLLLSHVQEVGHSQTMKAKNIMSIASHFTVRNPRKSSSCLLMLFVPFSSQRHRAACVIQAHFRGYKGRQSFLQQRCAILIIQRHARAMVAAKRERIKYIKLKKSMVVLQALVRGWLVRKRVSILE